ncbi:MAG: NAD(P)H-hydrate epimerase, partial [Daejeonella sp.]|uniref:NAD(P)H-hydrate epimerase n=1 Tax=Daejeonella sp. TaxID=2805397 RepID=UPI003C784C55
MQNLLTSQQTREADAHTISSKPISSIDLMEVASIAFVKEFSKEVIDKYIPISIYCGNGNNGGDGLAVARLLYANDYKSINVKISSFSNKPSKDFDVNRERIKLTNIHITDLSDTTPFPEENAEVLIDALLGSGFN